MEKNLFNGLSIDDRKEISKNNTLLRLYCIELASNSQSKNPTQTAMNFINIVNSIDINCSSENT